VAHLFPLRVYYEDTDLAGIVYYANYLKFIERARTEWVRSIGIDQTALRAGAGIVFAVHRVEADFLRPAVFEDDLTVQTTLRSLSGARLTLEQDIWREEGRIFAAVVTLVCLNRSGQPARIPTDLRHLLDAGSPDPTD
jgi:acyl-CoA thioester hydrolase